MNAITQQAQPRIDWIGFGVLLIGINASLSLLQFYYFGIPVILFGMAVFVRRYDWKNISTALLLTFTLFHPARLVFNWGLNPVLYALPTVICLLLMIFLAYRQRWKNGFFVLLAICALFSGSEVWSSASELGQCYVDDRRYTYLFICEPTSRAYQQIENLPVGMQGWCYYCFWY